MEKGQIRRGFKPLASQIEGKAKYIADCNSCIDWDDRMGCQNPNVLKYDMIEEGSRIYCTYWSNQLRRDD